MQRPLDVAAVDRLAPGSALVVSDPVSDVAVFNVGGRLFALEDACLSCGASLAGGTIVGMLVACARCGWRYDIASGGVDGIPALRVDTFDVRVAAGRVVLNTKACRKP